MLQCTINVKSLTRAGVPAAGVVIRAPGVGSARRPRSAQLLGRSRTGSRFVQERLEQLREVRKADSLLRVDGLPQPQHVRAARILCGFDQPVDRLAKFLRSRQAVDFLGAPSLDEAAGQALGLAQLNCTWSCLDHDVP